VGLPMADSMELDRPRAAQWNGWEKRWRMARV